MFRANIVICRYIIYVTVIRMVHAQYNGCLISGRHIPERLTDDQKRSWDDLWTVFFNKTSL